MARAPAVQEIEDLPEIDRLDGFPHPRATERLYGHEAAERTLVEAFESDRLHHGWLIAGAEGIGKATLAYRFARFLLATPTERRSGSLDIADDTTASRQVRALSHPGLLVIRRAYDQKAKRFPASISVDEVRRLKAFLGRTAERGHLPRRHRRSGRRAQHHRRQRAAEISRGAAAAHGLPADLVSPGAALDHDPLARAHARPSAARKRRPEAGRHAGLCRQRGRDRGRPAVSLRMGPPRTPVGRKRTPAHLAACRQGAGPVRPHLDPDRGLAKPRLGPGSRPRRRASGRCRRAPLRALFRAFAGPCVAPDPDPGHRGRAGDAIRPWPPA